MDPISSITLAPRVVHILYIFVLILFCLLVILASNWIDEKGKIVSMPRKPMKLCDKHGAYPEEASLHIDVAQDGAPDLRVEICPVCFYERQKEVAANVRK